MGPIKRSLLPNTITIYNRYQNADTGEVSFYRTYIQYTRFMTVKSSAAYSVAMSVASMGSTRLLSSELWIDPISSLAFDRQNGADVNKTYLNEEEWAALTDKTQNWTLQEGDYVLDGIRDIELPPDSEDELTNIKHYKINEINPVLDKPGNVHHWELLLV